MTAVQLQKAPGVEPVTIDEIKAHLKMDLTTEDDLVASLIQAAREWAERYTGRAFIKQTWRLWLDRPGLIEEKRSLTLPRSPLVSVESVRSFYEDGTELLMDSTCYYVDTAHEPGRLVLKDNAVWPMNTRRVNGIMIEYGVGYGEVASSVPASLRLAIKQLVSHWYEHRGEELMPGTSDDQLSSRYGAINVPMLVQALLNPYRVM